MRLPERSEARVVSCDVFDTVLHRDHRSESRRFRDIAALAARRLASEHGIERHPDAIWHVRAEVQRHAYRALALVRPEGDVRFADMVDVMARMLGIAETAAAILHEAEIAVERAQLTANVPLLDWLAEEARTGTRIIAVSDIYHEGGTLALLLAALCPRHPIARIYTSADHGATKRAGTLFARVLREEGVAAEAVLHIGDDALADVAMPQSFGLRTLQVARPRHLILRRRSDALRARLGAALIQPERHTGHGYTGRGYTGQGSRFA